MKLGVSVGILQVSNVEINICTFFYRKIFLKDYNATVGWAELKLHKRIHSFLKTREGTSAFHIF
jgi:hypothetical protein